jgi:prepilin-type N-terminal cleavage/methylation domain-containing protein
MVMKQSTVKQSGFSILELLIVLAVLGTILTIVASVFETYREKDDMSDLAGEIAIVANATTSYVFDLGPAIPVGPTTYAGVDWLRDSTCGGPATTAPGEGYLSCNFTADLAPRYGLGYQTVVTRDPASNNLVVADISITGAPVNYDGVDRLDLSGTAMRIARGRYANQSTKDISDTTLDLYIDYQYDPTTGAMNIVVDNASDGSDPFLSITGQNEMQADLDVGDGTYDVVDANNVFWGGTSTAAEDANGTQSALVGNINGSSTGIRLNGRGGPGSEIIFIRDGSDTGFDVKIANQADGELLLEASDGVAVDSPVIDLIGGGGNGQIAADDFYSKQLNRSLNQTVTDVFMANHDQLIPKPNCDGTGLNPTIYTAVSRFAGVDRTSPSNLNNIAAFQALAIDNGSTWRISLEGIVQDEGVITPPDNLASVMAVTKCS